MTAYKQYIASVKEIFALGLPLMFSRIFSYLINFADTAMVGQLSNPDLAAIALAGTFYVVFLVISFPLSVVTRAIMSRQISLGNTALGTYLTPIIISGFLIGCFIFVASIFVEPLIYINMSENIQEKASSYIHIIRYTLAILPATAILLGLLGSMRKTSVIMIATIAGNINNIALNYLLIFGHASFPVMGIQGAAISTFISEVLILAICITYLIISGKGKTYSLFIFPRIHIADIKTVIIKLAPIAIQNSFAYSIFLAYKLIAGQHSDIFLSVTHIVLIFYRINKILLSGFATSSSILISSVLATHNTTLARQYFQIAIQFAFVIGIIVLTSTLIWTKPIVSLFSQDTEVITTGVIALRFFAIFFLVEIIAYPLEIIFAGNGWGHFVLIAESIPNTLFTFAAALLFTIVLGKDGIFWVWGSFATYQVIYACILFIGYWSGKWKNMKIELPSTLG